MGKGKSHVKRSSPLVEVQDRVSRGDISLCGGVKADERLSCPVCHFERKREIFFVCGQEETGGHRETGNTALPTLQDQGISFGQGKRTVNEKAPYTFLFISLREPTSTPSGHILPREGGRAVSPHQSLPLGH